LGTVELLGINTPDIQDSESCTTGTIPVPSSHDMCCGESPDVKQYDSSKVQCIDNELVPGTPPQPVPISPTNGQCVRGDGSGGWDITESYSSVYPIEYATDGLIDDKTGICKRYSYFLADISPPANVRYVHIYPRKS